MKRLFTLSMMLLALITAQAVTYTVAGASAILNGTTDWAETNTDNDMTTEDGVNYTLVISSQNVKAGDYEFKIVEDHAWTNSWPATNYKLSFSENGKYTITYTFNADTKAVNGSFEKVGDFDGDATTTWTVAGDAGLMGSEWSTTDTSHDMTKGTDGIWRLVLENIALTAGTYNFKVAMDHSWGTAYPGSNAQLVIAEDGTYNVTFTFNESTHEVSATAEKATAPASADATFDFKNNNMDLPIGKAGTYAEQSAGDLGGKTITKDNVALRFVNAMTIPTRYYLNGDRGNQFQAINGGQMRVTAPDGYAVTSIKSVSSPGTNPTTGETTYQIAWSVTKGGGTLTAKNQETQTWTGNAESVLLSATGATYLASIEVTIAAKNAETALLADEVADTYTEVNGLAAFADAANNGLVKLTLTDAIITATMVNNWGYYVQDANAGANFYCTGLEFEVGDKISGVVYVKKSNQNVGPRICMTEKTSADELTVTKNGQYEAIEGAKIADINKAANKCRVVKISGVKVKGTSATDATVTDSDEATIALNNKASNYLINAIEGSLAEIDYNSATVIGILYGSNATTNAIMPLSIENTGTDGISNINAEIDAENVTIYNLQGIRQSRLQKGINIVNGKKIVVK